MSAGRNLKHMVIALGGNTLAPPGRLTDVPHQFARTRETMKSIADLVEAGHRITLTHGNGPQVGNILRRSELAAKDLYPVPLELCIADTQGGMGYMIAVTLENELRARGIDLMWLVFITKVLVDPDHPEFGNPTKPIGIFYPQDQAQHHMARDGWKMVHIPDKGWRRVVPSPPPLVIQEIDLIRQFVHLGGLSICCGGGGIPVYRQANGEVSGAEAVIDKDRTSAILAADLQCDWLVIITNVPQVCTGFGTPNEEPIDELSITEARQLLKAGEFPPGTMGPKIEAAADFLERSQQPDARVLITNDDTLTRAIKGEGGTWIFR